MFSADTKSINLTFEMQRLNSTYGKRLILEAHDQTLEYFLTIQNLQWKLCLYGKF